LQRDGFYGWVADAAHSNEKYLALFNTNEKSAAHDENSMRVPVQLSELGFSKANIRDL
jgi:hypothetical protein